MIVSALPHQGWYVESTDGVGLGVPLPIVVEGGGTSVIKRPWSIWVWVLHAVRLVPVRESAERVC